MFPRFLSSPSVKCHARGRRPAPLGVEELEGRDAPAAHLTATFGGGLLRVEGTPGADAILVRQSDVQVSVAGTLIRTAAGARGQVPAAAVRRVEVYGLGGDDVIRLDRGARPLAAPALLDGGAGDDVLAGGAGADTFRVGNADADRALGFTSADRLEFTQPDQVLKAAVRGDGGVFTLGADHVLRRDGTAVGADTRDFAFAGDGSLYRLDGGGAVSRFRSPDSGWSQVSGGLSVGTMTVAGNGRLYALDAGGSVYQFLGEGSGWRVASGNLSVGAMATAGGQLYALDAGGSIYQFLGYGSGWRVVSGGLRVGAMATAGGGLFALDGGGSVYQFLGYGSGWRVVSGADPFSGLAGANGNLYALAGGSVWQFLGSGGRRVASGGLRVKAMAVAGDGMLYALDAGGSIYQSLGSGGWRQVSGNGTFRAMAAAGDGHLYALDDGGSVWQFLGYGSGWRQVSSTGAFDALAAAGGKLYGHGGGVISQFLGYGSGWRQVSGNGSFSTMAVPADGRLYAQDGGSIYQFLGYGSGWRQVSGNDAFSTTATVDGRLYALDGGGSIYLFLGYGSGWEVVTGSARFSTMVATGDGSLHALRGDGTLFRLSAAGLTRVASGVAGVCPSADGQALDFVSNLWVYQIRDGRTAAIDFRAFAVAADGRLFVREASGGFAGTGWPADPAAVTHVEMVMDSRDPQDDSSSCGPNCAARLLRSYGFDVSAQFAKDDMADSIDSWLIQNAGLGTKPETLASFLRRNGLPDAHKETGVFFDRLPEVLALGRPAIALVNFTGDVGDMHYVVVRGFDRPSQTIYCTDTDGRNYSMKYEDFNRAWNWDVGWLGDSLLHLAGLHEGTLVF